MLNDKTVNNKPIKQETTNFFKAGYFVLKLCYKLFIWNGQNLPDTQIGRRF